MFQTSHKKYISRTLKAVARSKYFPILTGVLLLIFVTGLWKGLENQEKANRYKLVEAEAKKVTEIIDNDLHNRIKSLKRIVKRWENRGGTPKSEFINDIQAYIIDEPGYQAISWVDKSYHVRWIAPLIGNEAALNLNLAFEEKRRIALEKVKTSRLATLTSPITLVQGGKGFLLYLPIYINGEFEGILSTVFRTQEWLSHILQEKLAPKKELNFHHLISMDKQNIYIMDSWKKESISLWEVAVESTIHGKNFKTLSRLTNNFINQNQSILPRLVLFVGVILSLLISIVIYLVQKANNAVQLSDANQALLDNEITVRKKTEEKIKLAASVFTYARESIAITDTTGAIVDVNDTFMTTTGYSREEAIGQNSRILKSGRQLPEFYADMWKALLKEGYWSGELWNRRKSGEVYAEIKTISAVRDIHGITTHYVSLGNDITPIKEYQDQLERIAHYDVLTNLPNRSLLADRLSQAMLQCSRHAKSLAVVFLDLDGFKCVNDAHGHDMGDALLITLSVRMKKALREGDTLSRIGGDEFVAVLADLATVEDSAPVLERLLLAASEPITVGDVVLNVSASIGATLYPQDNVDVDQLIRHADQAMYVAKESGKNRYHLFDTAQDDAVKVQQGMLEAIRRALDNHQFVLHYQPKVNMRTGTVIGAEALIRWQHPERGLLSPAEFLPAIEKNRIMIEMGEWVIDSALTQISQWQAMGLNIPLKISVNIAAIQLKQPNFTQRLITLLAAHPNVEPHYLELEVLETSAFDDVHHISTTMNDCMALGVNFALDDFGTGYSSLTYLRRLPANVIKIDQTFVRDMLIDPDDFAIVEGVIALAKSFRRDVIAEGVETIECGTALLQLGCELAQGYGIARPMPASDIPVWISDWKPDVSWQS
jgi:diguanylate cyclase (GGDEF)-like protein/PAS domain S-box-containing protein